MTHLPTYLPTYSIKERVEDELRDVREEGAELRGDGYDVVEEITEAQERRKREAAAQKAKEVGT